VGAGMAGLTLAAKLRKQGRTPVVVERVPNTGPGYALGLYPLGNCVLHGLGTYEELVEQSIVLERYEMANGSGRALQSFDMSVLTGSVGPLLMIGRSALLNLLHSSPTATVWRSWVAGS
jgi:FAD-dependent urate hydroxylase